MPAALTRIAQLADGWNPAGIPVDGMQQMFGGVKDMARAAGRDPWTLELIVRANVAITAKPRPPDGMIFTGTLEQISGGRNLCPATRVVRLNFPSSWPKPREAATKGNIASHECFLNVLALAHWRSTAGYRAIGHNSMVRTVPTTRPGALGPSHHHLAL